jgi:hypothetical protein
VVPGGEHTFDVCSADFRSLLPGMAAHLGLVPRPRAVRTRPDRREANHVH